MSKKERELQDRIEQLERRFAELVKYLGLIEGASPKVSA